MRKRKIPFSILVKHVSYFDFYRITPPGVTVRGYMYKTDKITEEARAALEQYNNVKIYITSSQFAPEIKYYGVFVGDKCFK